MVEKMPLGKYITDGYAIRRYYSLNMIHSIKVNLLQISAFFHIQKYYRRKYSKLVTSNLEYFMILYYNYCKNYKYKERIVWQ